MALSIIHKLNRREALKKESYFFVQATPYGFSVLLMLFKFENEKKLNAYKHTPSKINVSYGPSYKLRVIEVHMPRTSE
jgi:hypothetical protein